MTLFRLDLDKILKSKNTFIFGWEKMLVKMKLLLLPTSQLSLMTRQEATRCNTERCKATSLKDFCHISRMEFGRYLFWMIDFSKYLQNILCNFYRLFKNALINSKFMSLILASYKEEFQLDYLMWKRRRHRNCLLLKVSDNQLFASFQQFLGLK